MPGLRLVDIWKSFEGKPVLQGVSLDLAEGELLVLLGPSGCGKSTMLRLIAGLEQLDKGEIWLGERQIDRLQPKDRHVAMVFQNYSLYPHMTVEENLAFPLRVAKFARVDRKLLVARIAELLGLTDRLKHKPGQLSGGQRQRVALGRAIIREPSLFLLDEPLSNLDADLRARMRLEIVNLQKRLKTTMIHVTHDQAEALTMADRIGLLNEGHLIQLGTPQDLYTDPANLFAARFIGSPRINTIPVGVREARITPLNFPLSSLNAKLPSRDLTAAVRPEKIRLDGEGQFEATVEGSEYLGDQYVVTLVYGSTTLTVSGAERELRAGSVVRFGINPSDLLFFDRDSGQRLR